ncbi:Glutathione-dependent formaldehyde-activating enzyme [Roseovarius sp. THAF27]|uniref:GFA family protein n=1 Tax=unclassified Roseovarius TaxID=2614913 RepID=UPI0012A8D9E9|nr:GFA family protein [Roseovarius sp. THAF27]QFT82226.1 Glutathione-dependent formaldehyde-activating enzyme [Roseovarius sp. THAF27]
MHKSGTCLCGAVTVDIANAPDSTGACHCGMCRKWSGGVYLGLHVRAGDATITGADNITAYTSSDWAERCFCATCGTNLFYRVTAPGPMQGDMHVGLGLLDDPSGITLTEEIFVDRKPDAYALAGDHKRMTEAETLAMFADIS